VGLIFGLILVIAMVSAGAAFLTESRIVMIVVGVVATLLALQALPHILRPTALAVVTPEGIFGIDHRERVDFQGVSTLVVRRQSVLVQSATRYCLFWGRPSDVRALAAAFAALQRQAGAVDASTSRDA
jgi:hypothetical protein